MLRRSPILLHLQYQLAQQRRTSHLLLLLLWNPFTYWTTWISVYYILDLDVQSLKFLFIHFQARLICLPARTSASTSEETLRSGTQVLLNFNSLSWDMFTSRQLQLYVLPPNFINSYQQRKNIKQNPAWWNWTIITRNTQTLLKSIPHHHHQLLC